MAGVIDTVKNYAKKAAETYKAGTQQTEGMGGELAATAQMNRLGEQALKGNPAPAERDTTGKGVGNTAKPFGTQGKEKRIDVSGYSNSAIPVHDKGGKIVGGSNVNINDGKHQLGILKVGERVLTEKQNADYEKSPLYDKGGKVATPYDMITGGKKPKKEIKEMVHSKTHNGKHVVTHKHHSPAHHPDETHMFNDMNEVKDHMDAHDAGTGDAAPMTAAPSPEGAPAAGAPPAAAAPAAA
jgi:hypothetical protein